MLFGKSEKSYLSSAIVSVVLFLLPLAQGAVRMSAYFGDGMVLQTNAERIMQVHLEPYHLAGTDQTTTVLWRTQHPLKHTPR